MLKLYVWENVLTDWTSGVMFALAESADEARALITTKIGGEEKELELEPDIYDSPVGFYLFGGG